MRQSNDKIDKFLDLVNIMIVIDVNGKILYYESLSDSLIIKHVKSPIGRMVTDLYPYFRFEETTGYKAISRKEPIINEYQEVNVDDNNVVNVINSAFPLINESGVVGCLIISKELDVSFPKKVSVDQSDFVDFLTFYEPLLDKLNKLKDIAYNDSLVLITGETGTGKELIARSIHNNSRRNDKPLIIQNCTEIPETLMESLMFGTCKGSFTGAIDKAGLFEAAEGGTVFLDEINSLPYSLQGKLLRTLEYKTIRRIGDNKEIKADFRIVAATNTDLKKLVEDGKFRADLFYRLNVINFKIPPLRERRCDIGPLIGRFIDEFNPILNKNVTSLTNSVMDIFLNYNWKGNVRELRNVIESCMNYASGSQITLEDIPDYFLESKSIEVKSEDRRYNYAIEGNESLSKIELVESDLIETCLKKNKYNVLQTAKELKIPRQTLYYKLKKYKLY